MNIIQALQQVRGSNRSAADIPVLIVEGLEAAEVISAYLNMEGGLAHLYGPFLQKFQTDSAVIELQVYEVDLRESTDSDDEDDEPSFDDEKYLSRLNDSEGERKRLCSEDVKDNLVEPL